MTNSSKDKGDRGELEVQALLRERLNLPTIRRALGAGRKDDIGDIDNVPNTAIQVAWWKDVSAAIRAKTVEVEEQRKRRRVRFAASFIRFPRGPWFVALSVEQWVRLWKYAQIGVKCQCQEGASTQPENQTRLHSHDHRSTGDGPGTKKARNLGKA